MAALTCCFWWLLLGVLLGWLASWLLGRSSKSEPASTDGIDYAAARAAGYLISGPQNLEIIEGIGPVIAQLLRTNGIGTFSQLATAPMSALQTILDQRGTQIPHGKSADLGRTVGAGRRQPMGRVAALSGCSSTPAFVVPRSCHDKSGTQSPAPHRLHHPHPAVDPALGTGQGAAGPGMLQQA